jgi:hypothetical protein
VSQCLPLRPRRLLGVLDMFMNVQLNWEEGFAEERKMYGNRRG